MAAKPTPKLTQAQQTVVIDAQPSLRVIARSLCPLGSEDAIDDLASVGNIALIKAFDHYDPKRGTLLAYARPVIEQEMRREMRSFGRRNIAGMANCSARKGVKSFERVHYEGLSSAEHLATEDTAPDEACFESERSALIARVLSTLTPREHLIIRRRYFSGRECRQADLAAELGISQQAVSAAELEALGHIKAALGPQAKELLG